MTPCPRTGVKAQHNRNYQKLRGALMADDNLNSLMSRPREPRWLNRFLSSVILAAGSAPLDFITVASTVEKADPVRVLTIRGHAFTQTLALSFAIEHVKPSEDDGEGSVVVRRLSDVESFDVWTNTTIGSSQWDLEWPGDAHVTLRFVGGADVSVPAARPSGHGWAELAAFVVALPEMLQSGKTH